MRGRLLCKESKVIKYGLKFQMTKEKKNICDGILIQAKDKTY